MPPKRSNQMMKSAIVEVSRFFEVIEGLILLFWEWVIMLWKGQQRNLRNEDIATEWIRRLLPYACCDFRESWKDGILLCSLMECLVPGSCPRPDLLDKSNYYNNTKTALDTFRKTFGCSDEIITADEIVSCPKHSEAKLAAFLCELKDKVNMQNARVSQEITSDVNNSTSKMETCFAKGCGLNFGFVGRSSKVTIFCSDLTNMDLLIRIEAPSGAFCGERITTRSPKQKLSYTKTFPKPKLSQIGRSVSHGEGWFNKRIDNDEIPIPDKKLLLEYETFPDKVILGYLPTEIGMHKIIILWQGQHIPGSPFHAKVEDAIKNFNDGNVVRLRSSLRQRSNLNVPYDTKACNTHTRKPSVRFIDIENGKRQPGKVVKRKVLRYIVKLADKDVAVKADSSEMLAHELLKLDCQGECRPSGCRRNSWGFVGDAERKRSVVRQFCVDLHDDEYVHRRFSSFHIDFNEDCATPPPDFIPSVSCLRSLKTVTEDTDKELLDRKEEIPSNEGYDLKNNYSCDSQLNNLWNEESNSDSSNRICSRKYGSYTKEYLSSNTFEIENFEQKKLKLNDSRIRVHTPNFKTVSHAIECSDELPQTEIKENIKVSEDIPNSNAEILHTSHITDFQFESALKDQESVNNDATVSNEEITQYNEPKIDSHLQSSEKKYNRRFSNLSFQDINEKSINNVIKYQVSPRKRKQALSPSLVPYFTAESNDHFDLNGVVPSATKMYTNEMNYRRKENEALREPQLLSDSITQGNIRKLCNKNARKSRTMNCLNWGKPSTRKCNFSKLRSYSTKYPNQSFTFKYRRFIFSTNNCCSKIDNYLYDSLESITSDCEKKKCTVFKSRSDHCIHQTTVNDENTESSELCKTRNFPFSSNDTKSEFELGATKEQVYNRVETLEPLSTAKHERTLLKEKNDSPIDSYGDTTFECVENNNGFDRHTYQIRIDHEYADDFGLHETRNLSPSNDTKHELDPETFKEQFLKKVESFESLFFDKNECAFQNDKNNSTIILKLSRSVKDIVKDFESKSYILPRKQTNTGNNLYALSINFPPLAANENRTNVHTKIRQWETTSSLPSTPFKNKDWKKHLPEMEKMLSSNVQSKTLFFENVYKILVPYITSEEPIISTSEGALLPTVDAELAASIHASSENISESCSDIKNLNDSPHWEQQREETQNHVRRHSDPGPEIEKNRSCKKLGLRKLSRNNSCSTIDGISSSVFSFESNTKSGDEYIDDDIPDYAAMFLKEYVSPKDIFRSSKLHPKAKAEECAVYGGGVYYGHVAVKNNFQVLTKGAGKGNLCVSLRGSSIHDVANVSVTYFRKDIYNVVYQVMEPGYYLITVKWSDEPVPGSPFICKVTY